MVRNGDILCIDSGEGRSRKARVSPDGTRRYTESVSTTPNFVPNESELVFFSDNTFTLRRDALFRSEPSFLLRGALDTPMNVHLGECPAEPFSASTCFDAMKDRADLVEMKTGRKESHAFFDTFMDVSEVAFDNLHRIIAAVTRIQNEGM
ncbi:hypothetical protein JL720_15293 [Aureococcus anophagefferens]|nr:hypothetical protein JL720_15293 [Aureococcus anophagefferens]